MEGFTSWNDEHIQKLIAEQTNFTQQQQDIKRNKISILFNCTPEEAICSPTPSIRLAAQNILRH